MELDDVPRQLDGLVKMQLGLVRLDPSNEARYERLARREMELIRPSRVAGGP